MRGIWLNNVHAVDLLVLTLLAALVGRLCTNNVLGTTCPLILTLRGAKVVVLHRVPFRLMPS